MNIAREGFGLNVFRRERITVLLAVTFKNLLQRGYGRTVVGLAAPLHARRRKAVLKC